MSWPKSVPELINPDLERDINAAKDVITAVLAARDKANLAVKMPSRDLRVKCLPASVPCIQRTTDLIRLRTNVKSLSFDAPSDSVTVTPNQKTIGKQFGRDRKKIVEYITAHAEEIAAAVSAPDRKVEEHWTTTATFEDGTTAELNDTHLVVTHGVPKNWAVGAQGEFTVYLDTTRTEELELEGRVRELAHKVQNLRKKGGLSRTDKAKLVLFVPAGDGFKTLRKAIEDNAAFIGERTQSAVEIRVVEDAKNALEGVPKEEVRVGSHEKLGKVEISMAIMA